MVWHGVVPQVMVDVTLSQAQTPSHRPGAQPRGTFMVLVVLVVLVHSTVAGGGGELQCW